MKAKTLVEIIVVMFAASCALVPLAYGGSMHCKGTATHIGMPAQSSLNLDDSPGHKVQLTYNKYKITSTCPEYDGSIQHSQGYYDVNPEGGKSMGYYTLDCKDGDKVFGKWSSQSTVKVKEDGSWEMTFTGEWESFGGTGKLAEYKGKGTFQGKTTPEGTTYDWEGDITTP